MKEPELKMMDVSNIMDKLSRILKDIPIFVQYFSCIRLAIKIAKTEGKPLDEVIEHIKQLYETNDL